MNVAVPYWYFSYFLLYINSYNIIFLKIIKLKSNKTIDPKQPDYFNKYYDCIKAQKEVSAISGCAACYCD